MNDPHVRLFDCCMDVLSDKSSWTILSLESFVMDPFSRSNSLPRLGIVRPGVSLVEYLMLCKCIVSDGFWDWGNLGVKGVMTA